MVSPPPGWMEQLPDPWVANVQRVTIPLAVLAVILSLNLVPVLRERG